MVVVSVEPFLYRKSECRVLSLFDLDGLSFILCSTADMLCVFLSFISISLMSGNFT
jgi:hypothetical protein